MKSLLLVSTPRSSSTLLYRIVLQLLQKESEWKGASSSFGGEVLAHDYYSSVLDRREWSENSFCILSQENHIVKHAADPIAIYKALYYRVANTLFIRRSITDCLHRIINRQWTTGIGFLSDRDSLDRAMHAKEAFALANVDRKKYAPYIAQGLICAQALYEKYATNIIEYEEFISSPQVLPKYLLSYGHNVQFLNYIDTNFITTRQTALAVRSTPEWKYLNDIVEVEKLKTNKFLSYFEDINKDLL